MATITHDNLALCEDCTFLVANDEATPEHRAKVNALWPLGYIVLEDKAPEDFSTRPCGGCGSNLAGTRHAAVVFDAAARLGKLDEVYP